MGLVLSMVIITLYTCLVCGFDVMVTFLNYDLKSLIVMQKRLWAFGLLKFDMWTG